MADLTSGDVTVTVTDRSRQGKKRHSLVDIDFGDGALTYPTLGVPLPVIGDFALQSFIDKLDIYDPDNSNGLLWKYDKANHKLRGYRSASYTPIFSGAAPGVVTVEVTDDDTAAATGVVLYVLETTPIKKGRALGELQFVSPTNVDGSGTVASGGTGYVAEDTDFAATGGLQVYFDEDATITERFLINNPTGNDVLVVLGNGSVLNLKHSASAAADGVPVFFDEDAANSFERLLFVSPTNAAGASETDPDIALGKDVATGTINSLSATELVELINSFTPAAQVMKAEAVGW